MEIIEADEILEKDEIIPDSKSIVSTHLSEMANYDFIEYLLQKIDPYQTDQI